jgi:hypothetical protein
VTPLDMAESRRWVKRVARTFGRDGDGISYTVVITPLRRRADGKLGSFTERPVYFTANTAEWALRLAGQWLHDNVPESREAL